MQIGEGWSSSVKACAMQGYLKQRLSVQASSFTPAFFFHLHEYTPTPIPFQYPDRRSDNGERLGGGGRGARGGGS